MADLLAPQLVYFKTHWRGDARRFALPADHAHLQSLLATLRSIYEELPPNCFLKYKDDEDDLITVSNEAEFEEALNVSAKNPGRIVYLSLAAPNDAAASCSSSSSAAATSGDSAAAAAAAAHASPAPSAVRTLTRTFSRELAELTELTARLCLEDVAVTDKSVDVGHAGESSGSGESSAAAPFGGAAGCAGQDRAQLLDDIAAQLVDQMNQLVLDSVPAKKQYQYRLHRYNTLEKTSNEWRREAFRVLTWNEATRLRFEAAIEKEAQRHIEAEKQRLLEKRAGVVPKTAKRPKLYPSCKMCSEPMSEKDGKMVCTSLQCAFRPR